MARRIYTHARQFPHLIGKDDQEIRAMVRRALGNRPHYVVRIRRRNSIVIGSMILVGVGLVRLASWSIGPVMMLTGGIAMTFLLVWNVIWLNTVIFRLTKEEVESSKST